MGWSFPIIAADQNPISSFSFPWHVLDPNGAERSVHLLIGNPAPAVSQSSDFGVQAGVRYIEL
ncbi:unnamed protein product [Prunus armeniaca]|uniref:Uncharacterized protein n=1 Tax=Prunus armeniaca TaxID=36596 RepID=A0A6J5VVM7_PRUAR|nr:unnamed protein product [Prunus armeniaca]